ncbi:hypothetical protein [Ornithinimicrobium kibberense]|uniref:hypothetical protein n=1 Tax=Ornithinimicrobium kibberense TaxID=282060 RepID=UPI00361676DF
MRWAGRPAADSSRPPAAVPSSATCSAASSVVADAAPRGVPPGGVRVGMLCPPAPRPSRPPAAGSCVGAHRERYRPRRRCP